MDYARKGHEHRLPVRDNPRWLGAVKLVLFVIVLLPFLLGSLLIFALLVFD